MLFVFLQTRRTKRYDILFSNFSLSRVRPAKGEGEGRALSLAVVIRSAAAPSQSRLARPMVSVLSFHLPLHLLLCLSFLLLLTEVSPPDERQGDRLRAKREDSFTLTCT